MIEVQKVSKTYGKVQVIDDVSTTINAGQITSIIGPNGAGKSTLLGLISRLIPMDTGEVYVDRQEIRQFKSRELAKTISVLKQSNQINLRLTVRELVSFGRFPYGQGRLTGADWEQIDTAISYMDLNHCQHKLLHQLSGGQQQRAFFAMVIAQNTDYILLDEPLNSLDLKQSVQIMQNLQRLVHDLGKTVVIVLHDINFASCCTDQIIALKNGKLVRNGPAAEIIDRDVLRDIYDMDIQIEDINDQKICVYFPCPLLTMKNQHQQGALVQSSD